VNIGFSSSLLGFVAITQRFPEISVGHHFPMFSFPVGVDPVPSIPFEDMITYGASARALRGNILSAAKTRMFGIHVFHIYQLIYELFIFQLYSLNIAYSFFLSKRKRQTVQPFLPSPPPHIINNVRER
jgi:hypothetical protein